MEFIWNTCGTVGDKMASYVEVVMKTKTVSTLLSLFFLFTLFLSLFTGSVVASSETHSQNIMSNVDLDGEIEAEEWDDADWYNMEFYLDINNSDGNVDGWNYMSVGEDEDNVLIALDLCSDRTNDEDGEWLSIFLNTANRDFTTDYQWESYLNNGTESLVYNVDNEEDYPLFEEGKTGIETKYVNSDSEIFTLFGEQEGDYYDLRDYSGDSFFNLTTTNDQADDNQSFLSFFTVDFGSWYQNMAFFEEYFNQINSLTIEVKVMTNTSSLDNFSLILSTNGTLDYNNTFSLSIDSSDFITTAIPYGLNNLTNDHLLEFALYGFRDAPKSGFKAIIDNLSFLINYTSWSDLPVYGYSSIKAYDLKWSYATSTNSYELHRQFEIAIPKEDLELYNSDGVLGIFVAGYGTMALEGTDYWFFGPMGSYIEPYEDCCYLYLDMKGDDDPDESEEDESEKILGLDIDTLAIILGVSCTIALSIIVILAVGYGMKKRKDLPCFCKGEPDCVCDFK